jgi:hypothetical protein
MIQASRAGLKKIIDMEPRLTHATISDPLIIYSQSANNGIHGDVRDIVFIRQIQVSRRRGIIVSPENNDNHWEIGISAKWNNDVSKNSRLAEHLDFCQSWFGFPCSDQYWQNIAPAMDYIRAHLQQPWRLLPDKANSVYRPMVDAFIQEMKLQQANHGDLANLLLDYLVGRYDFYKIMTQRNQRATYIQAFNLKGNLNQDCLGIQPTIIINPQARNLPTRIVSIERYLDRPAYAEIIMDNGWQFTFRLHNAESNIIPSLKFDIRFTGSPLTTWAENWGG